MRRGTDVRTMCAAALMLLELPRLSGAAEQWTATSTTNAPSARAPAFAFWTGTKMIVWGGGGATSSNTGGIYDPASDTWTAMSTGGAPTHRGATAVWTGSKMIVWGGYDGVAHLNTGATYDPLSDTWAPTSTVGAPQGRDRHTAVWTGSKMIVWGGLSDDGLLGTGGIYDPESGTWTATSMVGAPAERADHHAVWTGSKMIVWGGQALSGLLDTGGLYTPPGEGPLVAGTERVFALVSRCGIPDGARSLSVNLAVTQPTTGGHLRVYTAGTPLPTVSSINYSAGQTRANNAIVVPNVSGELAVWCAQPSGTVDFILDVNGYFDASGHFFTLTPCRLVDTRAP